MTSMKRNIYRMICVFMMLAACTAAAQDAPVNYVLERTLLNGTESAYNDRTNYHDGLGRPSQTLEKTVSGGMVRNRLAAIQEYDACGRATAEWLPVPVTADYLQQATFKTLATGTAAGYGDTRPYRLPVYEDSLLNRVLQQYGPGADWYAAGKQVTKEQLVNTGEAPLECKHYSIGDGYALNGGDTCYPAGELRVLKTTDEDGNTSYTFADKQGKTILERRMNAGEKHDTYYVYDRYENLCIVLQPLYQTTHDLDKYAFQYRYDDLDRCIRAKMPGEEHTEMAYDDADRLSFSQDGNQRAQGRWTYYLYDAFGRLTEQGECTGKDTASETTVQVQNHYDDYSFVGNIGFTDRRFTNDTSGNAKGSLTGSVITVFGNDTKLYVAHYYDIKGRIVRTVSSNLMNGYELINTTYTFTGNPETVEHTHTATGKPIRTETYTYSYDYADRLSKVEHTLGGTKVTLATYVYDKFGRLQSKSLHDSIANRQSYTYNIRSWLTGISGAKFTQNLYYHTGNGITKYNGNISSMTWKAGNESTVRGYKFTYDELDRMLNATYGETASISTNDNRFSENVTGYDKNGNITGLQRYGQTAVAEYGLIDDLAFTLSGNQLNRVDDAATASAYNGGFEFKDGVKQSNEYAYDANGNLTKDLNRNIVDIQYNCLNLPSKVTFGDGSTVTYTYAADGTKLRTVHTIGGIVTTTDYCGNVVYENGVQKYLLTEEGYVTLDDNKYHYYLKDHQGNNRVVVDATGQVEETNHYYPFGGIFASSSNSVQPYKYNGKELDTKNGLNWYDYGARQYDAALGRFTTVDPMAEKYYPLSPYAYCVNNPMKYIDVDGKNPRIYVEIKGFGHVFITTGNGQNTTVYSYGRYGNVNWNKSSSASMARNGEGVLIIMKGKEALNYIKQETTKKEARVYEVLNGDDKKVDKHFQNLFDSSNKKPSSKRYSNSQNARVIDEYDLLNNNCTTKSIEAIKKGTDETFDIESSSPSNLDTQLYYEKKKDDTNIKELTFNEIYNEYFR